MKILWSPLLLIALGTTLFVFRDSMLVAPATTAGEQAAVVRHRSFLLDPEFYAAAYANQEITQYSAPVLAGIVPHHLVATRLLADYYERLALTQKPSMIAVVGPDHLDRSGGRVVTTRASWVTPYETIPGATEYADAFVDSGLATIDERVFAVEHSISVETAFIAHAFPGVPVLAVALPSRLSDDEARTLGEWFDQNLPADALLLISADFSHEVTSAEAQQRDAQSIERLQQLVEAGISNITVDAPQAIRVLFAYAARRGATDVQIIDNQNSATVTGTEGLEGVTSYILSTFSKPGT